MSGADYLITCIPGLEDVASREAREMLGAEILEGRRGRVRFRTGLGPTRLEELRSAEHIHVHLGDFGLGDGPREAIYGALGGLDLEPYLEALRSFLKLPESPSFRITAKREGTHDFTSEDVGRWAGQAVVDRFGWTVDLENYDLNIFVRVDGTEGWAAGRLSRRSGRRRTWAVGIHQAGLNPLIAYGMVRLADPQRGESVLDPFCGGGTLPIEGALWEPAATWTGSDREARAIHMTRRNALSAHVPVRLVLANTKRLPFRNGSFDLVLSNLPFGRRSGSHGRNRRLYVPFFEEIARVLRPGGRAVVLTLERRLMEMVLSRTPFRQAASRVVSHGGLMPRIYQLEITDGRCA